ncbi:MAG: ABC transporter ATP-binding protein [Gemmatimonadetes bacterium]|nr:ABC transporter ATP-binding protein [Gemmatimonadota bacterium]
MLSGWGGTRLRPVAGWTAKLVWETNATLFSGLALTTLVRGVLPAALALTIRGLINSAVQVAQQGTVEVAPLVPWLVIGFVLSTVDAVSRLADKLFAERLKDDLNLRITGDVMTHAKALDLGFFEDPRSQDMLARTQQDPGARLATLVTESQRAITHLIVGMSLLAVLTAIEPLVPLVVAPFAVPFLVFQWRLSRARHMDEYSRATKRRWTGYFVSKLTHGDAVAEVKLLDLGPLLIQRFRSILEEFRDRSADLHKRNFRGSALTATLTTVALYLLFFRVAVRTLDGTVTLGDLAIFGGATARLRFAVDDAIRSLTNSFEQLLFVSNVLDFLSVSPKAASTGSVASIHQAPVAIDMRNVTFTYPGSAEPVICGVSLQIRAGEALAIVGENGAGKTTLVKLLARLYDPDDGQILFDGIDIQEMTPEAHRLRLSFVFQTFGRYEATIADNIAYGDWRRMLDNQERVEEVARLTGVHDMIEALPHGYDTWVGRSFGAHTLSGGEWQKVAMARAFARDASLLVLDEPTSNLDASAEYRLFSRFAELARGRTTILISHRFSTIGMADRIAVMKDGRLVEIGTHEELVGRPGVYATLYGFHERLQPRGDSPAKGAS